MKKPKMYDCFMLFNEIDLLKIRLEELYDFVDYFVIVEATTKFSGERKPLYFKKHEAEFEIFKDKIIYIPVNPPKLNLFDKFYSLMQKKITFTNLLVVIGFLIPIGRWKNDVFQRNSIKRGLVDCNDEDIILVSDLDEIPNHKKFSLIRRECNKDQLVCIKHAMYVNHLNGKLNNSWTGTRAIKFNNLKKYFHGNPSEIRIGLNYAFRKRLKLKPKISIIENGGWHFSYLGGIEAIMEKIKASSHTENDTKDLNNKERIKICLDKGVPVWGKSQKINYVKIDKTFPATIYKNRNSLKHLIKNVTGNI